MNKGGKSNKILVVIVVLVIIFGIWGYIGGIEAKKVGVTCDFGVGTIFCWKWHTNVIGQIGEGIDNALGGE